MKFKELKLIPRINKANKQINFSIPKKNLTIKELDKIQPNKPIKFLMDISDE